MKTITDKNHTKQNKYTGHTENTFAVSNPYELVVSLDNELLARQHFSELMTANHKNEIYIRSIN